MGGTSSALKRFLANKNTVTILGTLVIILVIWIGYNARIQAVTSPQKVPYAKETIQPRTKITADMIGYMEVPLALVKGHTNIYTDANEIIDNYTNVNTIIPEFSLFYKEAILTSEELPDVAVSLVKDGEVLFNLPVSIETTFGNSMYPGKYFDLYYKSMDDNKKVQYGRLITNLRILAVKDSTGKNVFENSEEYKTPSMLIFAIPTKLNLMLRKALYLKDYSAELIPVPIKVTASEAKKDPALDNTYLASFINDKTVDVPLDQILPQTTTTTGTD